MPEEGLALDGADTWIQSAYLLSSPNTVAALRNDNTALFPPWRCEVAAAKWGTGSSRHQAIAQGDFSQLEQQEEVLDSEIHWGMDVVVVRTAEKLLDVLNGVLTPAKAAPWVGEVPSQGQAAAALTRLIPVLYHMLGRAVPEAACHQLGNGLEEPLAACHFSWEYLHLLLNKVEQAMGLPPSSRFAVDQRVEAARKGIAIDSRATWASAAEVEAALEDLKGCAALPPAHLRRLWMACLHREWAAAVARPVDVMALAARRRERAEMEKAWDAACCALIEKHRDGWGCGSFSEDQRSNGGHACMSD